MKVVLVALLGSDVLMATNLLVSAVAMALGTFVTASPHRAAKIWGSQRLANLAPERRALLVWWYRLFGICLCLRGVLSLLIASCFPTINTDFP
jgi:integral membrane sensor domain MASE1